MTRLSQLEHLSRCLVVLCAALSLGGCPTTTGSGSVITDTGKARADREKAERDTRPIIRGGAPAEASAPTMAADAGAPAVDADVPPPSEAVSDAAADVAAPTTALVTDTAGAPAVLVDVVRPTGTAADDYTPVADAELGLVQVQRGGAGVPLQRGMALATGDEVFTSEDTVAILNYPPNIEIYVMPGTQIRVGSIFVKLGEIWVSIKGQLKEKFKVETEFVTAGVEGTEFLFRADRDGAVDVDVVKGAVLCTSKLGRWAPIRMARLQNFSARRDQARPSTRSLATADVARVRARVRPVSVAVATKLPPRAVVPLDKQRHSLPATKPATGDATPPPAARTPLPEVRTRPPTSDIQTKPDIRTAPNSGAVTTKPPAAQLPTSPQIRTLPRSSTTTTQPPATSVPKSTTSPLKTLPQNTDLLRAR